MPAHVNLRGAHFNMRQCMLAAGIMVPSETAADNDVFHVVELGDRFVFIVQPPHDLGDTCSIGEFFKSGDYGSNPRLPENLSRVEALVELGRYVTELTGGRP